MRPTRPTASLCLLLLLTSAARGAEPVDSPRSLSITPAQFELRSSRDRVHLLVSVRYADGSEADVTGQAQFEVVNPAIAAVDAKALVEPRGEGTVEIIARHAGLESRARIRVSGLATPAPIDFRSEVVAALGRGGCNQGACHGSPQGKNGFRLSLRGFDPSLDFVSLTRDIYGRRVNPEDPFGSLLLRKAAGQVPHQGGTRFRVPDRAYQILHDWIAEGCRESKDERTVERLEVLPSRRRLAAGAPRQQLIALARYSDGTARDVTHLAVFSSADEKAAAVAADGTVNFPGTAETAALVRYLDKLATVPLSYVARDGDFAFAAPPEVNFIDRHVFAKQRELHLRPAEIAGDAVFLRRVYLDAIGTLPTPAEARAFLESTDPGKRSRLIDALLERPEYAQLWALKWADVMRGNRETITERGIHNFHRYLIRNFAADRPFDELAREIVESAGNTLDRPQANFYRVARTPPDAAEAFSQLFLGVRIQCAKCHNHPYEAITQRDYYGLAAYFSRVGLKGARFGLDDEIVYLARSGEVKFPVTGEEVRPSALGAPAAALPADEDRRRPLADWLTEPGNRYFAASTVNRVWYHLLGQGIVDPIDDFRDSNPPANAELLQGLSAEFVRRGFRLKPLIRAILNSATYQLAAEFTQPQSPSAADPDRYFARAQVRMLSAEQILDAISAATGVAEKFPGYPSGTRAMELAEGGIEHRFLKAFAKPVRDVACDCARETEPSLNQVLHLLNNPEFLDKLDSPGNRLAVWIESGQAPAQVIESMYLATLSRVPTADELRLAEGYLSNQSDAVAAYRDLQHALINSNEFLLRH